MRRDAGRGFGVVVVVLEAGATKLRDLALDRAGAHDPSSPIFLAHEGSHAGVLDDALHHDVARSAEGGSNVGHVPAWIHERQRLPLRIPSGWLLQDAASQRLETALSSHRRLGAALGTKRQVEVFELGFGRTSEHSGAQVRVELALLLQGTQNGPTTGVKLLQRGVPFCERAELHLVQSAGALLAVARNERDRGPLPEQIQSGRDTTDWELQFGGELRNA